MTREELEMTTIEIVAYAGDARTQYLRALESAIEGKYDESAKCIQCGNDYILEAHKVQTKMIQLEAAGHKIDVSFLMVHAQDHLMTVMLLRDMVNNLIKMNKKINSLIDK